MNNTLIIAVLYGMTSSVCLIEKVQRLQNPAARVVTGAHYMTPTTELLYKLSWSNLKERRNKQKVLMMFKIINGMIPAYI